MRLERSAREAAKKPTPDGSVCYRLGSGKNVLGVSLIERWVMYWKHSGKEVALCGVIRTRTELGKRASGVSPEC